MKAEIDAIRRARTARNHSATHLMHKALREVLGGHVQQKGSLVDADKTRFDFAHNAPMTDDEIRRVEAIVNEEVLANAPGIVRVLRVRRSREGRRDGAFRRKIRRRTCACSTSASSRELCGGTHVRRTGDIGLFKIVMEGGVAAGIRRVEAITGDNAVRYVQELDARINAGGGRAEGAAVELTQRIAQVQDQREVSWRRSLAR